MALFTSLDGVDERGLRAEVNVQVGTGRVKELNGRGKQRDDGSYRNVEVVFDPDNPLLKRKVYGMLDSTAIELWEFAQTALADQRTVTFRIESQRKRGIDRTVKFEDLKHAEEVVRILAALDNVFSHEALTNPMEDPSRDNPSALQQSRNGHVFPNNESTVPTNVELTTVDVDKIAQTILAKLGQETVMVGTQNNSDSADYGSPEVENASIAEQFTFNQVIAFYSAPTPGTGNKSLRVEVTDSMLAQTANLTLTLLTLADNVQKTACGLETADRRTASYIRALELVINGIEHRYPMPIGEKETVVTVWENTVVDEASERLYGVRCIAYGLLPAPKTSRVPDTTGADATLPLEETVEEQVVAEQVVAEQVFAEQVAEMFDKEIVRMGNSSENNFDTPSSSSSSQPVDTPNPTVFTATVLLVSPDSDEFVAPTDALIGRVRDMCVNAGVAGDPHAVSDWLETRVGDRVSRRVHTPLLAEFVAFYEQAGPETIRNEVFNS